MSFTAKDVQELRRRTGAGMMECKRALEEAGGDLDKAGELLRIKLGTKAEKRAGRAASEGQIVTAFGDGAGVVVEVNCETDFVGRNEDFARLAQSIANHILAQESLDGVFADASESGLLEQKMTGAEGTLADVIKDAAARTGENIVVRRFARFSTGATLGSYLHHNAKVAALVEVAGGSGDVAKAAANSVAEHVAAGVPSVALGVSKEEIPAEVIEQERRIFEEQARASGKPDNIIQKMIDGRIAKYYKEVALIEQPWIRDDSRTIRDVVDEASRNSGATLSVKRFARFQMGD